MNNNDSMNMLLTFLMMGSVIVIFVILPMINRMTNKELIKFELKLKHFLVLGVFFVPFLIYGVGYNSITAKQESMNEAWAQVQTAYQRRFDLVMNLSDTVQAYAHDEQATFVKVAKIRSNAFSSNSRNAKTVSQLKQGQIKLDSALSQLMVVVEAYPKLKASQNFLALQNELERTENNIADLRQQFNASAKTYNLSLRTFPFVVVAKTLHFKRANYFQAQAGAEHAYHLFSNANS